MLEFLVANIFVVSGGRVFQQTVGIPMSTNYVPLLADIVLYSYEVDFIQSLLSTGKKQLASPFNLTGTSINHPEFENYLGQMYPAELETKDITESIRSQFKIKSLRTFNTRIRHAFPIAISILLLPSKIRSRSSVGCSKLKRSVDMTSSGKNGLNIRKMQVPNWTGPGVRRSKRPLLASLTRCNMNRDFYWDVYTKCPMETSWNRLMTSKTVKSSFTKQICSNSTFNVKYPPLCNCPCSQFLDAPCGNIVTGDLNIHVVRNIKQRSFEQGKKNTGHLSHIHMAQELWHYHGCMRIVCQTVGKERRRRSWHSFEVDQVDCRHSKTYRIGRQKHSFNTRTESIFSEPDVVRYHSRLHENFVTVTQTKHPTTIHMSARYITSVSWQRNLDLAHSLGTLHTISRICLHQKCKTAINPSSFRLE